MKSTIRRGAIALTLASSAVLGSAQFLDNTQFGTLPSCASNCAALAGAQKSCQANDWSCFCSSVWSQIQSAPTQACASSCPATDVATVYQWYTSNCGSDNGASQHPQDASAGSGSGSSGSSGNTGSGTSSASPASSSGAATSSDSTDGSDHTNQTWLDGHWRWVVMIIVLFVGILTLALVGLWLKKRHERRRDQITGGFNSGITERAPPMSSTADMSQMTMAGADTSMISNSALAAGATSAAAGGRDSPARTRDAFMPYGYGYTRSESRLGSNPEIARAQSPLARGSTPVAAMERGVPPSQDEGLAPAKKTGGRRVMVRERSAGEDSTDGDVSR